MSNRPSSSSSMSGNVNPAMNSDLVNAIESGHNLMAEYKKKALVVPIRRMEYSQSLERGFTDIQEEIAIFIPLCIYQQGALGFNQFNFGAYGDWCEWYV